MPKFEQRKTKEITLPASGAIVKIKEELIGSDLDQIADASSDGKNTSTVALATLLILEWDFEKEDGDKEPITEENVAKLNAKDLFAIVKAVDIDTSFLEGAQS